MTDEDIERRLSELKDGQPGCTVFLVIVIIAFWAFLLAVDVLNPRIIAIEKKLGIQHTAKWWERRP